MTWAYDPGTGVVWVSLNEVIQWTLYSAKGLLTLEGLKPDVLPMATGSFSDKNEKAIGEASFGDLLPHVDDVELGAVLPPGLDWRDPETGETNFYLSFVPGWGADQQTPEPIIIPEPGTVVMLAGGLLGLLLFWRGRRQS